jgi:hypothetical protein
MERGERGEDDNVREEGLRVKRRERRSRRGGREASIHY